MKNNNLPILVVTQLTHLALDKMATISQTLFSDAFFVNDKICLLIKIAHKFVLEGAINNKSSIGLDNGLALNKRQAIIWTNADPTPWHINAVLGGDELMPW